MQGTAAEQLTLRHARLLEDAAVTVKAGPFRAGTDSGDTEVGIGADDVHRKERRPPDHQHKPYHKYWPAAPLRQIRNPLCG
jgi:hypothetical protein